MVEAGRFVARSGFASEAGFVVAWSSGFVGATLGARYAEATTLLAWRYFLCVAVVMVVVFALGREWPGWNEVVRQAVVGVFSQVVYLGCIFWSAGVGVSGGIAALIAALQPLFAVALAGPVLGERAGLLKWAGLAVGFAGVVLVVGGGIEGGGVSAWGYALPFAGMLGLVAATLFERRTQGHSGEVSLDVALAIQFAIGAVFFGAFALVSGGIAPPQEAGFWVAVLWVVVLSGFGGYGFYWISVRRSGIGRVSSLLYLTPPTTMVWSYFMFGERVGVVAISGILVCAAGVFISNLERDGTSHREVRKA